MRVLQNRARATTGSGALAAADALTGDVERALPPERGHCWCCATKNMQPLFALSGVVRHLEERDLQAIGVSNPGVMVPPGRNDGRMHQRGAMREELVQCVLKVGNPQGKADRAAHTLAGLDRIDNGGVRLVKQLQGRCPKREDHRAILAPGPELG